MYVGKMPQIIYRTHNLYIQNIQPPQEPPFKTFTKSQKFTQKYLKIRKS